MATVGEPYSYDVDAVDPDGTKLFYFLIEGSEGMTIDPVTGLITWTPAESQAGEHFIEVTIT